MNSWWGILPKWLANHFNGHPRYAGSPASCGAIGSAQILSPANFEDKGGNRAEKMPYAVFWLSAGGLIEWPFR